MGVVGRGSDLVKAQPWQLDYEQYDLRFPVTPLYAHLDTERHVNNVAVLSFHSEARLRFQISALGERSWFSDDVLLRPRRTVTQFIGEIHYPGEVLCVARLVALDRSGYRLALGLFQNGECVGIQECLMGAWRDDRWIDLPEAVARPLGERLNPAPSLMPWPDAVEGQGSASWPCHSKLTARYGDMDPDGLLAELSVTRYMEQSRARPLNIVRRPGVGLLVARLDLVFRRWNTGLANIELPSGISRIGNSSFVVRGTVLAAGDLVATGESVMVLMNRDAQRAEPIVGALRKTMTEIALPEVS